MIAEELKKIEEKIPDNKTDYSKAIFYLLLFFAFIATVSVLKLTSSFFIPVTVSVLLSLVFYPFVKRLHRFGINWTLCILLIVLISVVAFYIIGELVVTSLSTIAGAYPKYEARFTSIYSTFAEIFKLPFDEDLSLFMNLWNSLGVREFIKNASILASTYMISSAKSILVIFLFIVFLLIELKTTKQKFYDAFPENHASHTITFIARKIMDQVMRYISIKFIMSLATGILVFLSTFIIKMDFPIIWGFLAFLLNFIPNFGSIISWIATASFALLQFYPSWGHIIYVAVIVLAINMVLGNIVEPRWTGSDLGLSPFLIIVTLSLWGWMWGFIGMILSVPVLVIIKIICENIKPLECIAKLMGNGKSTERKRKHQKAPKEAAASKQ